MAPLIASIALTTWTFGIHSALTGRLLRKHLDLVSMETEIEGFGLAFSDQQVADYENRSRDAEVLFLTEPGRSQTYLEELNAEAIMLGWKPSFSADAEAVSENDEDSPMEDSFYRFRLVNSGAQRPVNDSYTNLLEFLKAVDKLEKEVTVVHLDIKAVEDQILEVELLLRFSTMVPYGE